MDYPLRIPLQLKAHLRALRKSRGLTQAQLGALVGVKQARIAEIEASPGTVSLDQLTKVLAALGGTLHLHADANLSTARHVSTATSRRVAFTGTAPKPPGKHRTPTKPTASQAGAVIPAKKGTW